VLDGGARTNESAFVAAVKYCSLDIVQLLLRSGARVTEGVIESGVETCDSELVLFLLDSVADSIKTRAATPL
jgi:hypothetical protein